MITKDNKQLNLELNGIKGTEYKGDLYITYEEVKKLFNNNDAKAKITSQDKSIKKIKVENKDGIFIKYRLKDIEAKKQVFRNEKVRQFFSFIMSR